MTNKELVSTNNRNELETLQFTLQRQDDQSKALQRVISAVIDTKEEMVEMKDSIEKDVKELRDSITLNRHEISEVQSKVGKRSWELADELFSGRDISDDLFLAKTGHLRSAIYKRLKENFDISRYYDIRRVDFEKAKEIISKVELENLQPYQLRLTARHKEIALLNNDNIEGMN